MYLESERERENMIVLVSLFEGIRGKGERERMLE
jgi:hypothetical protein